MQTSTHCDCLLTVTSVARFTGWSLGEIKFIYKQIKQEHI